MRAKAKAVYSHMLMSDSTTLGLGNGTELLCTVMGTAALIWWNLFLKIFFLSVEKKYFKTISYLVLSECYILG